MNASAPRRLVRLRVWRLFVEAGWSIERVRSWMRGLGFVPKRTTRVAVEDLLREEIRRGRGAK